jgi:FKBP-type peptidyl-prolyl cis-trans isomerase 2
MKDGDVVSVHYTLTLDSGEKLDTSRGENRQPLEFTLGNAQMIAGFEKAVLGMRVRDKKHVRISPQDAYGALYLETTIPLAEYREVITKSVFKGELIGIAAQDLSKHQADGVLGGSTIGTVKKI